jgi:hypothetical protein
VRRRVVALCTVLAVLLGAVGLLGCGEPDEDTTTGSLVLTVYTSGTLQGDGRQAAQDGADAVKLALEQVGGMVGPFSVNVVSLDDTDPDTGHWGADQVVTNTRRAIADRNIMGYIGDSGSGATALTLPLDERNDVSRNRSHEKAHRNVRERDSQDNGSDDDDDGD